MNDSFADTFVKATKPVRYAAVAALSMLALFLLVLTIHGFDNLGRSDAPFNNTITVEGTGKAASVPNTASVDFTVTESAATVSGAQDAATRKTNNALAAVKALGVDDKDVKTISYNIYPQYEPLPPCYNNICPDKNPKIVAYQVSQTVEVKVRDTAKVGDLLQKLGDARVQNVSGPNFTVDDNDSVKNEARAEAIKNAQAKAQELAKELHVSLGKVVSFYENTGPIPYEAYGKGGAMMDMAASPTPSIPAGENETSVSVSLTYEIR